MKKLICMLLAIGLMLGLTACGSSSKDYAVNEMAMEAPQAADSAAGFVEELTTGTETGSQALPDSRVIWDVTTIGWLLNENDKFMLDRLETTPIPQYDHHYSRNSRRPLCKYVYHINRDALMGDLFEKVTR